MRQKPEPPPEGAVLEARRFLVKSVLAFLPEPEDAPLNKVQILEAYDAFIEDYPQIVGSVFDGSRGEGMRLAFACGVLTEIIESIVMRSGGRVDEVSPFMLAGRLVAAVSPERAQELIRDGGYWDGTGDPPEVLN